MYHYKVYVGRSDIHGVGLMAIDDIKKGDRIFYFRTKGTLPISMQNLLENRVSQKVIDVLKRLYYSFGDALFLHREPKLHHVNFINHSANPNVVFEDGWYIAKQDIKADEEVTLDFLDKGYHRKLAFKPKNL